MKKQYVMYPAHGVAEILRTETRYLGNKSKDFTILKVLENDMVIMLPTLELNKYTRPLVDKTEANYLRAYVNNIVEKPVESATWNKRYREYMEQIKYGDLREIAKVFNVLKNADRDLSFGERKLKELAKLMLEIEISIVLNAEVVL